MRLNNKGVQYPKGRFFVIAGCIGERHDENMRRRLDAFVDAPNIASEVNIEQLLREDWIVPPEIRPALLYRVNLQADIAQEESTAQIQMAHIQNSEDDNNGQDTSSEGNDFFIALVSIPSNRDRSSSSKPGVDYSNTEEQTSGSGGVQASYHTGYSTSCSERSGLHYTKKIKYDLLWVSAPKFSGNDGTSHGYIGSDKSSKDDGSSGSSSSSSSALSTTSSQISNTIVQIIGTEIVTDHVRETGEKINANSTFESPFVKIKMPELRQLRLRQNGVPSRDPIPGETVTRLFTKYPDILVTRDHIKVLLWEHEFQANLPGKETKTKAVERRP